MWWCSQNLEFHKPHSGYWVSSPERRNLIQNLHLPAFAHLCCTPLHHQCMSKTDHYVVGRQVWLSLTQVLSTSSFYKCKWWWQQMLWINYWPSQRTLLHMAELEWPLKHKKRNKCSLSYKWQPFLVTGTKEGWRFYPKFGSLHRQYVYQIRMKELYWFETATSHLSLSTDAITYTETAKYSPCSHVLRRKYSLHCMDSERMSMLMLLSFDEHRFWLFPQSVESRQ